MQKIFYFVSVLALAFFASCGSTPTPEAPAAPTLPAAPLKRPTVVSAEARAKCLELIKKDAAWLASLEAEAKQKKLPVDTILFRNADFYAKQHPSQFGLINYPESMINGKIELIKADASWLSKIQAQATADGISLEEALRKNALFVLDQDLQ